MVTLLKEAKSEFGETSWMITRRFQMRNGNGLGWAEMVGMKSNGCIEETFKRQVVGVGECWMLGLDKREQWSRKTAPSSKRK